MHRSNIYEAIDTTNLVPVSRLNNFQFTRDIPDVRGWDVFASDGRKIGRVEDLLVDRDARDVHYLAVALDRGLLDMLAGRSGHVLIPLADTRLDRNRVYLDSFGSSEISSLQTYDLTTFGSGEDFSEREKRLTLSEEELAVGKRRMPAGEAGIQKRVESKHVREEVPVTREEVTVERRPASGLSTPEIREGEIRVPVMKEEVHVEKRMVPKEEVVIKKHVVEDRAVVEDDIRKERAEVIKTGDVKVHEKKGR